MASKFRPQRFLKFAFWSLFTPLFLCGFRLIYQGNQWLVDASSTTNSKLFVSYPNPTRAITNDLPSGDALAGSGTVTTQQLMNSILSDYNSIQGAFVTLVDTSDSDYAARSTDRIITIEEGSASGLTSGGEASLSRSGNIVNGCKISLKSSAFNSAKTFTATVTHELGHCLGLDHPMDTVNAIMSYFVDSGVVRLQADDRMGIVYLYPADPEKAREEVTLGMACERK